MDDQSLAALFVRQCDRHGNRTLFLVKQEGRYQDISWIQAGNYVCRLALALNRSGIKKGDAVALLSENRPEWAYADLAILSLGAVVVPIYAKASESDILHLLCHSESVALFVSTNEQLDRIQPILSDLANLRNVIVFDQIEKESGKIISLTRFTEANSQCTESSSALFRSLVAAVKPEDLATIIYTSGTTGDPKGVMLTHRNFLVNCHDSLSSLPISESDVNLSFLPLSHVFERMAGYYLALLSGGEIAYAENMATVGENMREVRPTMACGVPRFFEKMYAQINMKVRESGKLKQWVFNWAYRVGKQLNLHRTQGIDAPFQLRLQEMLAKRLVYRKIYKGLGGRLKYFVSGGAPLSTELAEFFYAVGVLILEGYGLTETSPVIAVNRRERFKFGTVGLPLAHVEVKICEDSEIAVRGLSVMQGYFKDTESTRDAIRDGWFYTGDLGMIDQDGFLSITGRKKDIIVTSGGKNISPQKIEQLLLGDPLIEQIVIVGDRRNFLTALIVPDFEQVKLALLTTDYQGELSPSAFVQNTDVHDLIWQRIDERTNALASYEKIKYCTLLTQEFSQHDEEITATLKVRRPIIYKRYREAIERMYQSTTIGPSEGRNRTYFVC